MIKKCSRCKKEKILADFPKRKSAKSGYSSWCKLCFREHKIEKYKDHDYRKKLLEKRRKWQKEVYYDPNKPYRQRVLLYKKSLTKLWKEQVISAYGNRCVCCGETKIEFLTIDHKNGDGAKHRKELNRKGRQYYEWLIKNNFPRSLGLQVLCFNCNCSLGLYKYCPHEKERQK